MVITLSQMRTLKSREVMKNIESQDQPVRACGLQNEKALIVQEAAQAHH